MTKSVRAGFASRLCLGLSAFFGLGYAKAIRRGSGKTSMHADWLLLAIALSLCGLLVYELRTKRAIVRGADRWTVDWVQYQYRPGMYIFSIALQILVMILSFVTFIKTF